MVAIDARPGGIRLPSARPSRPGHVPVGPISVFNGDIGAASDLCLASLRSGAGARVATANLDFVARARHDATLEANLREASLVVADGSPVAWLARVAGGARVRRIAGVDLVAALLARAPEAGGLRVAVYGSTPEILESAVKRLGLDHASVEFVALVSPPFREATAAEVEQDIGRLADARPDLVFVALGCPRQERFIATHWQSVPGAVWMGVGGTFDFYAGKRRRAPRLMQWVGGEWLARLAQEPKRLWRRYFLEDLPALLQVLPGCLISRLHGGASPAAEDLEGLREALTSRHGVRAHPPEKAPV